MDPSRALEALVQQVLGQYPDINLDQRVDREGGPIVRGTYSSVQRGILRPEGMKVAIKTACRSTPGDENTIVVRTRICRCIPLLTFLVEHTERNPCMD